MALIDRLAKRAEEIAEHRRRNVEAAWTGKAGVTIIREADRLAMSGRGLIRQWLEDSRLRFAQWSKR